jgi:hydroxymethylpyrimidine pyrophosphatase-like HAD family hydrolase
MNSVRLLSLDFDGTLVRDWAPPPFPQVLVDIMTALRRQDGVKFALNTGRSLALMEHGLEASGFPIWPDFALTTEREVFRWTGSGWEDFGEWNSRCVEAHDELFARIGPLLAEVKAFVEMCPGAHAYYEDDRFVGIVAKDISQMDDICEFIRSRQVQFPSFGYQRNSIYTRFCHASYHKGAALAELQRLVGISPAETFAAGDNLNDISMLDDALARFLACPSNATGEVKSAVRRQNGFVAKGDSGQGVAEALAFFIPGIVRQNF